TAQRFIGQTRRDGAAGRWSLPERGGAPAQPPAATLVANDRGGSLLAAFTLDPDCILVFGDRMSEHVNFERGIHVHIRASDGTWRRDCIMIDVSKPGASLCIAGSFDGLDLKEFFLLLSS